MSALSASVVQEAKIAPSINADYEWLPATPQQFVEDHEFFGATNIWPTVRQDFLDFFKSKKHEGIFCESIGAGKSFLSSLIAAYGAHLILCYRNPQKNLGLSPRSRLAILNMGTKGKQAKDVVFAEIKARIDSCPWFRLRYRYDQKVTSELRFPKNLFMIPGNSRETTPLGYNLIYAILDEADWFVDTEDHDVAEAIYLAMHRRLESRLGNKWDWKLVAISSPKYQRGFIETKMLDADCFTRRRTLWEAKPWQYVGKMVPWESHVIPEQLLPLAIKNPSNFKRDFMALPSGALEPYFKVPAIIDEAVDNTLYCVENDYIPSDIPIPQGKVFVHVDLGLSRDAAGVAFGYRRGDNSIIHLVWRIKAAPGTEVNFASIRGAILALRTRGWRIAKVSYDGWQSVDSVQILTAKGIECETLSVDRTLEPYDTLQEAANEGRLRIPNMAILIKELKDLERKKGVKVDHPEKGSKDCADACAGVCFHLRSSAPAKPEGVLIPKRKIRYERSSY